MYGVPSAPSAPARRAQHRHGGARRARHILFRVHLFRLSVDRRMKPCWCNADRTGRSGERRYIQTAPARTMHSSPARARRPSRMCVYTKRSRARLLPAITCPHARTRSAGRPLDAHTGAKNRHPYACSYTKARIRIRAFGASCSYAKARIRIRAFGMRHRSYGRGKRECPFAPSCLHTKCEEITL